MRVGVFAACLATGRLVVSQDVCISVPDKRETQDAYDSWPKIVMVTYRDIGILVFIIAREGEFRVRVLGVLVSNLEP